MKLIYDGREVNRISVETLNDNAARGGFFARKLIEFADGGKLYLTEKITAGANIAFSQGDNLLIGWLFGAAGIEGKEIAVSAEVTQGTAAGRRLPCVLYKSGGKVTLRLSLLPQFTVQAARIIMNGAAAAEITGLPAAGDKNTLIITLNEAIM